MDEYQEYMETLRKMNNSQEDLMDIEKYFISPHRYGTTVPWKMMRSPFAPDDQEINDKSKNTIAIKSPKMFIPHENSMNKLGVRETLKRDPSIMKNRISQHII